MRRYSDDAEDRLGGMEAGAEQHRILRRHSTDSDEDELARGSDDPLSLEELDGWMSQINQFAKDDSVEITAPEEESKEPISDSQIEAEILRKELEDLKMSTPFEKAQEAEEEEEDDGLDLEFIAQVQKERTSLRALEQAQSQVEVPAS